ncbi:MAG: hypothetical protein KU37_04880 [Sulfuricurvum sp. PC08-66]|nr:MAG: hypothetical protein KU37_04880 [Sulfuricurvum sp. PC08-66]
MLAVPLKMDKQDSAVSPAFGHAKYFAFIEGDSITIERNTFEGGGAVAQWIASKGAKELVFVEFGNGAYQRLKAYGITLYYAGKERITLPQILEQYRAKTLLQPDEMTIMGIIKEHMGGHSHGGEHHHH